MKKFLLFVSGMTLGAVIYLINKDQKEKELSGSESEQEGFVPETSKNPKKIKKEEKYVE